MTTIQTYATRILQVALARQDVPRTDKADDVAFSDIAGVAQAILNEIDGEEGQAECVSCGTWYSLNKNKCPECGDSKIYLTDE